MADTYTWQLIRVPPLPIPLLKFLDVRSAGTPALQAGPSSAAREKTADHLKKEIKGYDTFPREENSSPDVISETSMRRETLRGKRAFLDNLKSLNLDRRFECSSRS
jgi:hypothetical protein